MDGPYNASQKCVRFSDVVTSLLIRSEDAISRHRITSPHTISPPRTSYISGGPVSAHQVMMQQQLYQEAIDIININVEVTFQAMPEEIASLHLIQDEPEGSKVSRKE